MLLLSATDEAREARARRRARSQGLVVVKQRSPRYINLGYGPFLVVDGLTNVLVSSEFGMDLDELQTFLDD
jgi:hypothetical protein